MTGDRDLIAGDVVGLEVLEVVLRVDRLVMRIDQFDMGLVDNQYVVEIAFCQAEAVNRFVGPGIVTHGIAADEVMRTLESNNLGFGIDACGIESRAEV
ncbi:hypothetical protein D3C71_2056510 [compost metagenome]